MGKIQVNALVNYPDSRQFNEAQRPLWERFLQHFADRKELKLDLKDDSEPAAIINSLKDWLDSGDDDAITGLSGAESSTYEDREPPYPARNGPVQDLDELLLVKGITPELFYGRPEIPGISSYLTVHGATPGEGTGSPSPAASTSPQPSFRYCSRWCRPKTTTWWKLWTSFAATWSPASRRST